MRLCPSDDLLHIGMLHPQRPHNGGGRAAGPLARGPDERQRFTRCAVAALHNYAPSLLKVFLADKLPEVGRHASDGTPSPARGLSGHSSPLSMIFMQDVKRR